MDKESLREYLKKTRVKSEEADRLILKNLLSLPEFENSEFIFSYISFGSEPDTSNIISEALKRGKRVAVPICEKGNPNMELAEINENTVFEKGLFGVPQPADKKETFEIKPDFAIVPGLGFDETGSRIGYGKGYYDRFLTGQSEIIISAITYESQIMEQIPVDSHDIKVDIIITERRIIKTK